MSATPKDADDATEGEIAPAGGGRLFNSLVKSSDDKTSQQDEAAPSSGKNESLHGALVRKMEEARERRGRGERGLFKSLVQRASEAGRTADPAAEDGKSTTVVTEGGLKRAFLKKHADAFHADSSRSQKTAMQGEEIKVSGLGGWKRFTDEQKEPYPDNSSKDAAAPTVIGASQPQEARKDEGGDEDAAEPESKTLLSSTDLAAADADSPDISHEAVNGETICSLPIEALKPQSEETSSCSTAVSKLDGTTKLDATSGDTARTDAGNGDGSGATRNEVDTRVATSQTAATMDSSPQVVEVPQPKVLERMASPSIDARRGDGGLRKALEMMDQAPRPHAVDSCLPHRETSEPLTKMPETPDAAKSPQLEAGDKIRVEQFIKYKKSYVLHAGLLGEVLEFNSDGHAFVDWKTIGKNWLRFEDFRKVSVVEKAQRVDCEEKAADVEKSTSASQRNEEAHGFSSSASQALERVPLVEAAAEQPSSAAIVLSSNVSCISSPRALGPPDTCLHASLIPSQEASSLQPLERDKNPLAVSDWEESSITELIEPRRDHLALAVRAPENDDFESWQPLKAREHDPDGDTLEDVEEVGLMSHPFCRALGSWIAVECCCLMLLFLIIDIVLVDSITDSENRDNMDKVGPCVLLGVFISMSLMLLGIGVTLQKVYCSRDDTEPLDFPLFCSTAWFAITVLVIMFVGAVVTSNNMDKDSVMPTIVPSTVGIALGSSVCYCSACYAGTAARACSRLKKSIQAVTSTEAVVVGKLNERNPDAGLEVDYDDDDDHPTGKQTKKGKKGRR